MSQTEYYQRFFDQYTKEVQHFNQENLKRTCTIIQFKDNDGLLHRENGPAYIVKYVYEDGRKENILQYYRHGKRHRVGLPSCISKEDVYYYQDGKFHRLNGPAAIHYDIHGKIYEETYYIEGISYSSKQLYEKAVKEKYPDVVIEETENQVSIKNNRGELHNENGPAYIYDEGKEDKDFANGRISFYKDNKKHREDGPAHINSNGYKAWWINGQRHREDGPAVIYSSKNEEYFLNDIRYSKTEWENRVKDSVKYMASIANEAKLINSDDIDSSLSETNKQTVEEKKNNMANLSIFEKMFSSAKSDSKDAAWRIAADGAIDLMLEPIITLGLSQMNINDKRLRAKVLKALQTDAGRALFESIVGNLILVLPVEAVQKNNKLQRLGVEFRIHAFERVGKLVSNATVKPMFQMLLSMATSLPDVEEESNLLPPKTPSAQEQISTAMNEPVKI